MNKLEKYYGGIEPEWFNYYLQKLNFDKLERLEPMRRKLMDRKTEFEESGYEIAPTIKINETILETLKQKISKIHTGMKHTEKTRKKLSIINKGRTPWNLGLTKETDLKYKTPITPHHKDPMPLDKIPLKVFLFINYCYQ